MVWEYTTKSGELTIREWSTCFELTYNDTGQSHIMGDGVDFNDFQVGTAGFYAALIEDIESSESIWIEHFIFDHMEEYLTKFHS